jgi:hypothetical protein
MAATVPTTEDYAQSWPIDNDILNQERSCPITVFSLPGTASELSPKKQNYCEVHDVVLWWVSLASKPRLETTRLRKKKLGI